MIKVTVTDGSQILVDQELNNVRIIGATEGQAVYGTYGVVKVKDTISALGIVHKIFSEVAGNPNELVFALSGIESYNKMVSMIKRAPEKPVLVKKKKK